MAYEYLSEEARALIGVESGPFACAVDADRALITHWVEAYQDGNPLYSNEEYAKATEYGGIIAPPGMLITWTFPLLWTPESGRVDRSLRETFPRVKRLLGTPLSMVATYEVEWLTPVKLGDQLTWAQAVTDVSPKKKTRVGEAHFVTLETRVRNQHEELVGVLRAIVCCYQGDQS